MIHRRTFAIGGLLLLVFYLYAQGQTSRIYLSDSADSAVITANGKIAAIIEWDSGAVKGPNDTIIVSLGDTYKCPAAQVGENIPLNYPITLSPVRLDSVLIHDEKLKIRFYSNEERYSIHNLIYDRLYSTFKYDFTRIAEISSDSTKILSALYSSDTSFKEISVDIIKPTTQYVLFVQGVVKGKIPAGSKLETTNGPLLVPQGDKCSIYEGVSVNSPLVIMGTLNCKGLQNDSIILRNVKFLGDSVNGFAPVDDNSLAFTKIGFCQIANRGLTMISTMIGKLSAYQGSNVNAYLTRVDTVTTDMCKVKFDSCQLGINGGVSGSDVIFHAKACHIENINGGPCAWFKSFVKIVRSTILSRGGQINSFCGNSQKSLIVADSNSFICSDSLSGGIGLMIEGESFGLIRHNVFKNFRVGINTDEGARAVIYNNSFIQCRENCFCNSGGKTSISISNNIFYNTINSNEFEPIKLENTMVNRGSHFWIGPNIWYHPKQSNDWYIGFRGDATIHGDTIGINQNPYFRSPIDFTLNTSSPAIDRGIEKVIGFSFSYRIFDTTVTLPDTFCLSSYYGSAPDIGAYEFNNDIISSRQPIHKVIPTPSLRWAHNGFLLSGIDPKNDLTSIEAVNLQGRRIWIHKPDKNRFTESILIKKNMLSNGCTVVRIRKDSKIICQWIVTRH